MARRFLKTADLRLLREVIKKGGVVKMLRVEGAAKFPRSRLDSLEELAKVYGAKGLAYIVADKGELKSPILKFLKEEEIAVPLKRNRS